METTDKVAYAGMTDEKLHERGVDAVERYLGLMGFEVLDRRWSCKWGTMDIVARDFETDQVCFVEVRTRRTIEAGIPAEDITAAKQRRSERVAMSWLAANEPGLECGVRFDAIGICVTSGLRAMLRHHRHIFDAVFED